MFNAFSEDHGIIYEVTPPYSPKSNGLTKRKNRILKGMMNAMLISFGVLMNLLGGGGGEGVILTACRLQNKIPCKKTDKPHISYGTCLN